MELDSKTAAVGILLIGLVAMAGWVGFLYVNPITKTKTKTDEETDYIYIEETPTGSYGLPSDWSTAPNSSYIMIYNETGGSIKITLEDILKGVRLWMEQDAALASGGGEIYAYRDDLMELSSFKDPSSGLYVTGVDILDVIEFSNTYFGYDLEFTSHLSYSPTMITTTQEIYRDIGAKTPKPWILAIAADGKWLADAPFGLGEVWGNFSVFADYTAKSLYNLESIEVSSSWEVEVIVDGVVEYVINRTNIIDPYYPDGLNYSYYTDGYSGGKHPKFNFDRQYWGRNMSSIINMTSAKDLNYTVTFKCFDDFVIPNPSKLDPFNNTDINNGLSLSRYNVVNVTNDLLPVTDKLISLIYQERRFAETDQSITDPYWPYAKYRGYHGGPFYLIVPGWIKENYGQSIKTIEITTYSGPIP